jgi:hypothetical protein
MTVLSLVFGGISVLLSIVVVQISIFSSAMYKGSCFNTFSPAFVIVITLDYGHSNWGEMKSK